MTDLSERLSSSFTLEEMVRSETAERVPELLTQQRNPPPDVVENLRYLCQTTLQPIRDRLSYPIGITSGYRSDDLNQRIGGSPTSQHRFGQAADCGLSSGFLQDPASADVRSNIERRVQKLTGRPLRDNVNPDFYLFAFICLDLDKLDVDQVIHEYGVGFGQPAWVHVSASREQNRRQILALGDYVPDGRKYPDVAAALAFGV
jgi:Peptidase M15